MSAWHYLDHAASTPARPEVIAALVPVLSEGYGNVRNPASPVIAMTANALQGDRQRCIDAGMDDFLAKPATAVDLYGAIDRALAAPNAGPRNRLAA